ncbi:hypothetical protein BPAE_0193g00120 [Botrytis paeoniae]|uniref:Uncharacterized protein n=1 Tax=Botrytis paeoniae TaxID=278948 RepID=A0A4Z1FBW9_9HELO|nr:hypothetical protein BPAE_0193g00120 [Botrytis paeoniae]
MIEYDSGDGMRGADMNSELHTLARVSVCVPRADESFFLTHANSYICRQKQDNIDPGLQSLSDQQTKYTISHLHTHPGAARRSDTQVATPGWVYDREMSWVDVSSWDRALNNTEQHIQETLLGASGNIGMDRRKSLVVCLIQWQHILPLGFSLTTVIVKRMMGK